MIAETVRALDCDWRKCYLFVRNQIRFTPYRNFMRGPERTLLDREGNDADQAQLLYAMLKACGYDSAPYGDEVTIMHLYPPNLTTGSGGFRVPLAGTAAGYDAASWLGAPASGNVAEATSSVMRVLSCRGFAAFVFAGATVQESVVSLEHYWVRLTADGITYDLDPSFKPSRITPPSRSITNAMNYSRSALLAAAGGVHGEYDSVRQISFTNLAVELSRLSGNLAIAWRTSGTNAMATDFTGDCQIVAQNPAIDACTFNGATGTDPEDFIWMLYWLDDYYYYYDQPRDAGNWRVPISITHSSLTVSVFMDEIASRNLWLSYTNAGTTKFAVIKLDDTVIAAETVGSTQAALDVPLAVTTPINTVDTNGNVGIAMESMEHVYTCVERGVSNVFVFPVGMGNVPHDGMRLRTLRELERLRATSRPSTDPALRARALQVAGQQWMEQTALSAEFSGCILGSGHYTFYRVGVVGQKTAPFYDIANCTSCTTNEYAGMEATILFDSALEHAVWDQLNGTNNPSVSTVRIIDLANASSQSVFLATAENYSGVLRSLLVNYPDSLLDAFETTFETSIISNRWILLPRDGEIALNSWKGYGYVEHGLYGNGNWIYTGMVIDGGLFGADGTTKSEVNPYNIYLNGADALRQSLGITSTFSMDPVEMCSGADTLDRTDLQLASPLPLTMSRRFDSRQRHADGPFGRGWSHAWDLQAVKHTDARARLGHGTPAAAVPSAVAMTVAQDLLRWQDLNATNATIACLVAKWWADQLVEGTVNVRADGQTIDFQRMTDGSYMSAPGITATLAANDTGFVLQSRLGNTTTFGASGMVTRVQDPSSNFVQVSYHNTSNDYLTAVSNSFGQKLTFNWTWTGGTGHVTSVSDSAGRTVYYRYSPSGCLTGVTDAAGFVWNYTYDSDNNLVSEIDPGGVVVVRNQYNSLGQVTTQVAANGQTNRFAFADGASSWHKNPLGGKTSYEFDSDGRTLQSTTPDGATTWTYYDKLGQAVSNLDALGRVSIRAYDASNNLVSVTEAANTPDARTVTFGYDSQSHLVAITNPLGRVTRMTYDASHRITSRISPDGTTLTNTYEAHGLPVSTIVRSASGQQLVSSTFGYSLLGLATNVTSTDAGATSFRHDSAGNPTNIIDALGRTTRLYYDRRGMLTNTQDAAGNRTVRTYTSAGRLAATVDPLSRTNTLAWTPSGQQAATRFANGAQTTNEYDQADRLVAVRDARGTRVQLGLDVMGRATNRWTAAWAARTWYRVDGCATTTVDAVGGRTDIAYDSLSRPVIVVDPLRRTWETDSDPMDTLTNSVDARGRATRYALDLMGRRTRVTYPSGRTEGFGFDALGRMTSFTNSEGRVYQLAYDAQGRLLTATNAAGEQVFRNYFDPCGNLTNKVDAASRRINFQYDVLNRCTNTTYADGSSENFTFDAVGNLLTARNAATTNTFAYSSMNQLTSAVSRVAGVTFTNLYRYDLSGLATNVVYPDGKTVRYAFDPDGNVTNITDWAGHVWQVSRDAAGRMTALAYPNGITGSWGYDASSALTNWAYTGGSGGLPGRSILRDVMGLKIVENVTSGPVPVPAINRQAANTFDAADRLTSAQVITGTATNTQNFLYDPCGALTNVTQSGSGVPPLAYTYDLAGRMTSATASNLSFSASYDALGNRVKTTTNGTSRLWVIDHTDPLKRPLMETTTNGTPVRYYVWGAGRLLAAIDADGTTRYAHSDEQGSIVALTSTSGAVLYTASYGPYGEPWGTTGT
ncbi:MAG: DUF6531 domain-containing protein, partial [bacterium]